LAFLPVHFLVFGANSAVAGLRRWRASTQWFTAALASLAAAGFYTIGVAMMLSQPTGPGEIVLFTVAGATCLGILVMIESMAREADSNRTHA
jgi:peptidoglycan/LPS O-acetylase OafA/YrhL